MSLFGKFKVEKIKPALKMSVQRIELLRNKKSVAIKKSKRIVAELLAEGKEEKARITTEHIVREDFLIEAYDIIELLCEVLLERLRLLEAEKQCPFDMREAVCTLIYAANRTEIKELQQVKDQLTKKYGKDFADRAANNHNGCVNERVVHKLSAQPPNAFLVLNYMKELAREYDVDWQPDERTEQAGTRFDAAMVPPSGATVGSGAGSGLGAGGYRYTDGRILPPGQVPPGYRPGDDGDDGKGKRGGGGGGDAGAAKGSSGSDRRGGGGRGGGDDDGDGGDMGIPVAPRDIPTATPVDSARRGQQRATTPDMDLPAAPTDAPRAGRNARNSRGGGGGGGARDETDGADDQGTYGADAGSAVPDYDELAARFSRLKGG